MKVVSLFKLLYINELKNVDLVIIYVTLVLISLGVEYNEKIQKQIY